ncbi:MAG: TolC family protein [Candidatus Cloacimonetes bacterium]|nr:TolC family protein [Candidatus Cloacimonadota bacterium]MBS3767840.1 TolC family protein [Candidatus Cloacimonadota bacterium]
MKRLITLTFVFIVIATAAVNARELSLQEAIELTKIHNKKLQKAEQEVKEYKQDYLNVRGKLFPQLTLSAGYQYKKTELPESSQMGSSNLSAMIDSLATPGTANEKILYGNDRTMAGYVDGALNDMLPSSVQKETSAYGSVKLDQVIFMGGKLINGITVASKLYHLQEKKYFVTKQDVIYEAISNYYGTKMAKKVWKIKREALSTAQKHLEQVQNMYEQGLVSEYDKLRANLEVKQLKPEVLNAKKDYQLAVKNLKNYVGITDTTELILISEIELPKIDIDYNDAIQEGLRNRVELELADLNVEVNKVNYRYEKGNFLPQIGLSAEYNYFGQNEKKIESQDWGNYYQVGIGFSMPLFTGLSNTAKKAKARHALKQAKISRQDLKEKIELDIRNSVLQLKADLENIESQKENVELAEKALKIAEARYDNQLANQLEVFDAQLNLQSAKLSHLNATYKVILSYEKLRKAIGRKLY